MRTASYGEAWGWDWVLVTSHLIGDVMMGVAYLTIPLAIYAVTRKTRLHLITAGLWGAGGLLLLTGLADFIDLALIGVASWRLVLVAGVVKLLAGVCALFYAYKLLSRARHVCTLLMVLARLEPRIQARVERLRHDPHYTSSDDKEWAENLDELHQAVCEVRTLARLQPAAPVAASQPK